MDSVSFLGATLSDKDTFSQFEVNEADSVYGQKIIIKQVSLGIEAKEGEYNVVQAESRVNGKETLKIPIAVLKLGETRVLRPNLEFPSASVTLRLTQGTGPVHICGQQVLNEVMVGDWDDEDEEEEDYDEPPAQTNGKGFKR